MKTRKCLSIFLIANEVFFFSHSAPRGAPEGLTATGLPAAESGPPGSAPAEAVEPGKDSAGPGVPAPQTGSGTAQPQTPLLPQTVASGLQEGRRVEGRLRGAKVCLCCNMFLYKK